MTLISAFKITALIYELTQSSTGMYVAITCMEYVSCVMIVVTLYIKCLMHLDSNLID